MSKEKFEDWKWNLKRRIEEGTIKVDVNGEEVLMKKTKILPFPKSPREWTRIHPPVDEEGNMNWFNFLTGGKNNFIKLLVILGIIALAMLGVYEIMHNPCVERCVELYSAANNSTVAPPICAFN